MKLKGSIPTILLAIFAISLTAQSSKEKSNITYTSDFRFRIEQDWNSKKSDGTFREDRTRLRYRVRAGMHYEKSWYKTGFKLRTGNPIKQQDPQLTLGDGFKEFSTLPIGLEKAYFKGKINSYTIWLGKNTYPFEKNNELYWSDNVYPEGVFFSKGFSTNSHFIDSLDLKGGHFVISSNGTSLVQDSYFQGYQLYASLFSNRIELFPSLYIFKNMPSIPDGNETFNLDYSIFHLGSRYKLMANNLVALEIDYCKNLNNYSMNEFISQNLKQQNASFIIGLRYGKKNRIGDYLFKVSYAYLQRFSAVDYLAQNDWARWDYSSLESPDGRLTNLQGMEIVASYMIDEKVNLTMKYYSVKQLISYGSAKENGSRIRLDLDAKF